MADVGIADPRPTEQEWPPPMINATHSEKRSHAEMSMFRFDNRSRDAIAAAGTDVNTVLAALHGDHPQIRRHLRDGGLHIYAATPTGHWLAMTFTETQVDEEWLLTSICADSTPKPA